MQTTWLERGTVRGRVALLLRSAEIQPLFEDFPIEFLKLDHPPQHNSNPQIPSLGAGVLQGGFVVSGPLDAEGSALRLGVLSQVSRWDCCFP